MTQETAGRRPLPSQERRAGFGTPTVPPIRRDRVRWVTLREAHARTGIPISTLRNWSTKSRIPTQLDLTERGPRRMVGIDEVLDRARRLGRLPEAPLADERTSSSEAGPVERSPNPAPEGAMIVPVDAWNRVLNQLGNLHDSGQQLAAARERAARAETEAEFLRERLAELRAQLRELEEDSSPEPIVEAEAEPEPEPPRRLTGLLSRVRIFRRR